MPQRTVRAHARTMPIAKSDRIVGEPLPDDLAHLPDRYAMPVVGDCLAPEIPDGALIMVDQTAAYAPGDLVVIFRRPLESGGQPHATVKRLVMAPPMWVKAFPFQDHPESCAVAMIVVEQINPRRQLGVRCADVLAIHKCLGVAPDGSTRMNVELGSASAKAPPVSRNTARNRVRVERRFPPIIVH